MAGTVARQRKNHLAGLGLVTLVVLIMPTILNGEGSMRLLVLTGLYVTFSMGLQISLGYAGMLNLGIPAFIAVGAYGYGALATHGVETWYAFLMAVGLSCAVALCVGVLVLRLRALYFAIAAFGLVVIAESIAQAWKAVTGGAEGMIGIPQLSILGRSLGSTDGTYFLVWAFALVFMMVSIMTRHSAYGRSVLAVRDSEVAAASFGVPARRRLYQIFVLGAGMSGAGGALYAHNITVISPSAFSVQLLLMITVVVVVGGCESVWGVLIGALLVIYSQEQILPRLFSQGNMETIVFGLLLVVIMMFAPAGILGELRNVRGLISRSLQRRRMADVPDQDGASPAGVSSNPIDEALPWK